jgi:hypothetical protein
MRKKKSNSKIKAFRFKTYEEKIEFEEYLKSRGIDSVSEYIRISREEHEKDSRPIDAINTEMRYFRKQMRAVEKKVDITAEILKETTEVFCRFINLWSRVENEKSDGKMEIKIDKQLEKNTLGKIVRASQGMGTPFVEEILRNTGYLDEDERED